MILATLLCTADAAETRRFALVVGANDGGTDRPVLRYALDDAQAMWEVLEDMGGVARSDRRLLSEPTTIEIEQALDGLSADITAAQDAGARAELVVYYSGHSDERGLLLGGELYPFAALRSEVEAVPADVKLIVLDACASGAAVRAKGGVARPAFLVDEARDVQGTAWLTSSSATEAAQESDRVGGSFFTHYLVSGLRGGADLGDDGLVTLTEAYQYAYAETLRRTERTRLGPQHPSYDLQLVGTGDLVVTDLREASAKLVLDEDEQVRVFVRDERERLVAEVLQPAGRVLELGLAPGTYSLVVEGDELAEGTMTLAEGAVVALSSVPLDTLEGELAIARGGTVYRTVPVSIGIVPEVAIGGRHDEPIEQKLAISLGVNLADRLEGLQLAVVANVVRDDMDGAQVAAAFNRTGGGEGAQVTGGLNLGGDHLEGSQVAGGLNVATMLAGAQVAPVNVADEVSGAQTGVVNVARRASGSQAGVVNVAAESRGLQLGVINVTKAGYGVPIGLVSVNPRGYNALHVWADPRFLANAGLTYGGRHLYTTLQGSWDPTTLDGRAVAALGFGGHVPIGRFYVDLEGTAGNAISFAESSELLVRPRLVGGFELLPGVALFAGPTGNLLIPFDGTLPWWISVGGGVRIGGGLSERGA